MATPFSHNPNHSKPACACGVKTRGVMKKITIMAVISSQIIACSVVAFDSDGQYHLKKADAEKNRYSLTFQVPRGNTIYENEVIFLERARTSCIDGKIYVINESQKSKTQDLTVTDGSVYITTDREVTRYSGSFYCNPTESQLEKQREIKSRSKPNNAVVKRECEELTMPLDLYTEYYKRKCEDYLDQDYLQFPN